MNDIDYRLEEAQRAIVNAYVELEQAEQQCAGVTRVLELDRQVRQRIQEYRDLQDHLLGGTPS